MNVNVTVNSTSVWIIVDDLICLGCNWADKLCLPRMSSRCSSLEIHQRDSASPTGQRAVGMRLAPTAATCQVDETLNVGMAVKAEG